MVLLLDNHDSFTYNLARYINLLGFATQVIRSDNIILEQIKQFDPTHIIISPGPGIPQDAGISKAVVANFYTQKPILGVCLGHQAIGEVFGAKTIHAKRPLHGKSSEVIHTQDGLFKDLPNPLIVGRYHSLILDGEDLSSEIMITAKSIEGEIMALKHKDYPLFGVQFHPESILTPQGLELLNNFISYK